MADEHAPVTKVHVVVLAVADAGGSTEAVDTEDVAVAAYQLSPSAFAWKKYPKQIALDSVRVTLYDAGKDKYGSLVGGSLKKGWYLTPAGVSWLESNGSSIRAALESSRPETRDLTRAESRHRASELARIKESDAYKRWTGGFDVSAREAAAVFRIDAYTSERDRSLKMNKLREFASESSDKDLISFVEEMRQLANIYISNKSN